MQTPETLDGGAIDDQNSLGYIRINHSVIRSIVRLAALEVDGVCGIATGLVDQLGGIGDIFSKKESDRGVKVIQKEGETHYQIEIRLILAYGCDIPKTAEDVQVTVRNRISAMTGQEAVKVDVIVDGIRMREERPPPAPNPHSDPNPGEWDASVEK